MAIDFMLLSSFRLFDTAVKGSGGDPDTRGFTFGDSNNNSLIYPHLNTSAKCDTDTLRNSTADGHANTNTYGDPKFDHYRYFDTYAECHIYTRADANASAITHTFCSATTRIL